MHRQTAKINRTSYFDGLLDLYPGSFGTAIVSHVARLRMKYLLALIPFAVGGIVWVQAGFGWAIAAFPPTIFVAGMSINAIEKSELRETVRGKMGFDRLENVDEDTYRRAQSFETP